MSVPPDWLKTFLLSGAASPQGQWLEEDSPSFFSIQDQCKLMKSNDSFDAGSGAVVTQSQLGGYPNQDCCCQTLWQSINCATVTDPSPYTRPVEGDPCSKTNQGSIRCDREPEACSKDQDFQGGITGQIVSGSLCSEGNKCYDQYTCEHVNSPEANTKYSTDLRSCCVDLLLLQGGRQRTTGIYSTSSTDDERVRNKCIELVQNRVTDYKMQEPDGPGGYQDKGEFDGEKDHHHRNHHHHHRLSHGNPQALQHHEPQPNRPQPTLPTHPKPPPPHPTPMPPHPPPRPSFRPSFGPSPPKPLRTQTQGSAGMRGSLHR